MALRDKAPHDRADTAGGPDAAGSGDRADRPDLLGRIAAPLAAINRAPLTSYHVVMVVTALLTVIGLGMVLSSSNVLAFSGGGTPFDIFLRQAMFVLIGWMGFVLALRLRIELLRAAAFPLLLVSIGLLVAVLIPGIGSEVNGSRGWIDLGIFSIQPAEIAKFASSGRRPWSPSACGRATGWTCSSRRSSGTSSWLSSSSSPPTWAWRPR